MRGVGNFAPSAVVAATIMIGTITAIITDSPVLVIPCLALGLIWLCSSDEEDSTYPESKKQKEELELLHCLLEFTGCVRRGTPHKFRDLDGLEYDGEFIRMPASSTDQRFKVVIATTTTVPRPEKVVEVERYRDMLYGTTEKGICYTIKLSSGIPISMWNDPAKHIVYEYEGEYLTMVSDRYVE